MTAKPKQSGVNWEEDFSSHKTVDRSCHAAVCKWHRASGNWLMVDNTGQQVLQAPPCAVQLLQSEQSCVCSNVCMPHWQAELRSTLRRLVSEKPYGLPAPTGL